MMTVLDSVSPRGRLMTADAAESAAVRRMRALRALAAVVADAAAVDAAVARLDSALRYAS
jgi:hypothetical protein